MQSDKLELDGSTLKVLASNTRRDLLKALDKRRKTLTELSSETGIKKPAVLNHLALLMEVGLVFKGESQNKFIYYELSEKGKGLTKSDNRVKFIILLTSGLATFFGGLIVLYGYIKKVTLTSTTEAITTLPETPETPSFTLLYELIFGVLLIMITLIIFHQMLKVRNNKKRA
ncbi:MAG: winged helix-turn-helix domain-containing protein [Candidatus Methanoperedens sp.]